MSESTIRVEVNADVDTGEVLAVYIRVREGKVANTQQIEEGVVMADYDDAGRLLGIELLGPCNVDVIDRITATESASLRRTLRATAPRELVVA